MHFTIFATLALALAGTTHAELATVSLSDLGAPVATNVSVAGFFPVSSLDTAQSGAEVTTAQRAGTFRNLSVAIDSPATLLLCQELECASCLAFDLKIFPHRTCITTNFIFVTFAVSQPAADGLSFGVFAGTANCGTLSLIPAVNECFLSANLASTNNILLNP